MEGLVAVAFAVELFVAEMVVVGLLAVEMLVDELLTVELLAIPLGSSISVEKLLPEAAELKRTGTAARRTIKYVGPIDGAWRLQRSLIVAWRRSFAFVVCLLSVARFNSTCKKIQ